MNKLLAQLALRIARWAGAVFVLRPCAEHMQSAHEFIRHVEAQLEPWEWKQRQALRAMRNRFPKARVRDLNLAIEIAVQECSGFES